jgi:uncharacterized SAM-dependent methyltransferase
MARNNADTNCQMVAQDAMSKELARSAILTSGYKIAILLKEREILDRVRRAFRDRELPEEVFYWFPASVQAWAELCRSSEYRNANRAIEVLNAAAAEIWKRIRLADAICGLGCGEGSKDAILAGIFRGKPDGPHAYIGADFSQALLELALEELGKDLYVSGLKCDLGDDLHLESVCTTAHENHVRPVIFTVLGNTLGAFGAYDFPRRVRRFLRSNDFLVLDGEIFSQSTLAGYDNPTNRRFAWGPLTGVGITENDGRLEFSTAPEGNGLLAVTKHFVATRDLRINIGGETIEIAMGEKLRMSSSMKYTDESILLGAVEAARFRVEGKWTSSDGKFVLACAKPV